VNPEQVPSHLLSVLLLIPLLGTFAIGLLPATSARTIAIVLGVAMVVVSAMLGVYLDPQHVGMQFVEQIPWIRFPFQVDYHVGVDGLSFCLVALTSVVTLAAILASKGVSEFRPKLYYSMLMLLTASILGVFVSLDLIQFFVFWELELAPMYFLIAIWGGPRRDYAAMKFLIYTFFGGIFMFAAILYLYLHLGSIGPDMQTFDMVKLATLAPSLSQHMQFLACIGFMMAFLIKLPSFPFHTWLPDAHVEAPTPVSMILAGLLLKMGSYGLVRICVGFFPDAIVQLGNFLVALGCFNIVWAAIACLVQDDMKRIIAFSSVSHMGFVTLGIGSLSAAALNGAIFQMIGHGVISAALFFLVGVIYDRCHTRQLSELGGGLAAEMPTAFYFWILAAMANLGLPGLAGFVAEVTTFYGAYTSPMANADPHWVQTWIIIGCTGVILTAGYMLWLLKRLFYGPILPKWAGHLSNMNGREMLVAGILSVFILALGMYPMMVTNYYTPIADRMAADTVKRMAPPVSALPGSVVR
jgi:NADH-quinone oxidoreductase subunit M